MTTRRASSSPCHSPVTAKPLGMSILSMAALVLACLIGTSCATVSQGPATPAGSVPSSPSASPPASVATGSLAPPTIVPPPSAAASNVVGSSTPPTVGPSPTVSASATPKPTRKPTPSATGAPTAPNLVVSKFTSDVGQLALNVPANFKVTVKNVGSDAGAFQVVVFYSPKGSNDQTAFDAQSVASLAAGQSVQLTFTGSVSHGGDYLFSAVADSADEITESSEDDNSRTLPLSSESLPNLKFDPAGVTTRTCTGGPDQNVEFDFGVDNLGTADVTKSFSVAITYYLGGNGSGTLDPDTITSPIPAGIGYQEEICRTLPGSGSFEVHFVLDSDHVIDEANEDDNEAKVDVVVP